MKKRKEKKKKTDLVRNFLPHVSEFFKKRNESEDNKKFNIFVSVIYHSFTIIRLLERIF